jgi:hypothetical protein
VFRWVGLAAELEVDEGLGDGVDGRVGGTASLPGGESGRG